MMSRGYTIERAEKHHFSVFQAIYADADIELWYDWKLRLNDTTWTDNCFWVLLDGRKVGGAIMEGDSVIWPFLVAPFEDRVFFWKAILHHMTVQTGSPVRLVGMLDRDMDVLLSFGCRIVSMRRMMCRPTEPFDVAPPQGYERRTASREDIPALVQADNEGYAGGIIRELFGEEDREQLAKDFAEVFRIYEETGTTEQFSIVSAKGSTDIAGFCQAGAMAYRRNDALDDFSSIGSIAVLPAHRNKGLAEYMLKHALNEAHKTSRAMRLAVTVGNNAESLYRRLGFVPGPRFTNMVYKKG